MTMSRKYMGRRTSCTHPRLKERPMYFKIISCLFFNPLDSLEHLASLDNLKPNT